MNAIQIKVANFIDCKLGLGTGTGWKWGGMGKRGVGQRVAVITISKGDFL